jgi:hypothetical protein
MLLVTISAGVVSDTCVCVFGAGSRVGCDILAEPLPRVPTNSLGFLPRSWRAVLNDRAAAYLRHDQDLSYSG